MVALPALECTPVLLFFFNDTATTEIYTLSLHDALPISRGATLLVAGENFGCGSSREHAVWALREYGFRAILAHRSEEHTSELQSLAYLVCPLLLEKKKTPRAVVHRFRAVLHGLP